MTCSGGSDQASKAQPDASAPGLAGFPRPGMLAYLISIFNPHENSWHWPSAASPIKVHTVALTSTSNINQSSCYRENKSQNGRNEA